ncbi:MAG: CoA transferase, partial [Candidatus Eremiobacteraeota bacterium]|nr:CoA transferase [Candidatus Eremiobacteraeota bacterium]
MLTGLRVLDLSTMIVAPLAGTLLADWGADVVKIEQPLVGDHVRRFGAQRNGQGLYWKTLGRCKQSVALDLHVPEVQALVRRWAPAFDVIVENFRPGTLERWNLGPDVLRATTPGLVVLRTTAFGQEGPYRNRPGFGTIAEAMSGMAAVTGFPDRPPLLPAFPLADVLAGYLGASAILAALFRRGRTGVGEVIDLAIYEAALKVVESQIVEYDQNGTLHAPHGNRIGDSAPRGAYACADGKWLALSASTQAVAERVLRTVGGEELAADARFRTNLDRLAHVDELDALVAGWCAQRTRDEALAIFDAAHCATGPLENVETMLDNPQVVARESIVSVDDPVLGPVRMSNVFPRFASVRREALRPGASHVGEHTRDVLARDLQLGEAELERLSLAGAFGPAAAMFGADRQRRLTGTITRRTSR